VWTTRVRSGAALGCPFLYKGWPARASHLQAKGDHFSVSKFMLLSQYDDLAFVQQKA
jgi:hypothetical protein